MKINFRNNSTSNSELIPGSNYVFAAPLSQCIESEISGRNHIGLYSTVNRCTIGSYSNIGVSSYIADTNIGRYSYIGSRCSIGGFGHPLSHLAIGSFQWGQNLQDWGFSSEMQQEFDSTLRPTSTKTFLGSDVWVGDNAVILAGVRIGDGAVVGAGTIVTKNIPDFSIVVGNPAHVVRYRFSESLQKKILKSPWWTKELEHLKNLDFENPENCY
jgi:acetyltransferase-like isoleucine patch superfamily enzyme